MLEVEATGNAIHIHYFTTKIQSFYKATFHRQWINLSKVNTATGNKFFFESCFPSDIKGLCCQKVNKLVLSLGAELAPFCGRINFAGLQSVVP